MLDILVVKDNEVNQLVAISPGVPGHRVTLTGNGLDWSLTGYVTVASTSCRWT